MKQVEYNPLDKLFKNPVGAVNVKEKTFFRLLFTRPSNPSEVFLAITKDGEEEVKYLMNYKSTDIDGVMEYDIKLKIDSRGLYFYHFVIQTDTEIYRVGCDEDLVAMLGRGQDWQLTVYDEIYKPVTWLSGGVIYQIMTDRFNIGGERLKTKTGDVIYRDDWGGVPDFMPDGNGKILNNDFFGGNIRGIINKLAYIKSLGITCIYLNPIFEAHSNHKYDTGNYRRIDPDFGTLDDFKELIKKAGKKGIKIILDGVFSHTGDDSIYFNKYNRYDSVGAYQSEKSPYHSWYSFKNFEEKKYDSWWGIEILPETNEKNVFYDEFINGEEGIVRYWTEMGIGGWRLDVVDELPDGFLDRLVYAAKKMNPDSLILGEVWEDASNKISYSKRRRYLQGGQLDSVTNYPFKEDILHFIKTGDASRLNRTVNVLRNNYPKAILDNLMNLLDTHDTIRILTCLGNEGNPASRNDRAYAKLEDINAAITNLKMATILQFTLMGVPCVYYGDEIGLEGYEDPFNRRCFPWYNKNSKILKWYKRLGAIRDEQKHIYSDGDYSVLKYDDGIFAFSRFNGEEESITIVNNSGKPFEFNIGEESYTNLIDFKPFYGKVNDKTAVIIKLTEFVNFPHPKVKIRLIN